VKNTNAFIENYAKVSYCAPFAMQGWVYRDGSLSIDAYLRVANARTCTTAKAGEQARIVPCKLRDSPNGPQILIDCALLQVVRKNEVRTYIEKLRSHGRLQCEDGTPLAKLGA
jgi:hypothetical protein